jgi:hypothetical protein
MFFEKKHLQIQTVAQIICLQIRNEKETCMIVVVGSNT